jgi:hypothetical protein
MNDTQMIDRKYGAIAWGLLFIVWGFTIMFGFIPFAFGLLGTGLVLLGMNMLRSYNSLPLKDDNTIVGILALVWGALELARPNLSPLFKFSDWDWVVFATLLVVLGVILVALELTKSRNTNLEA